jgi:predicted PurR-regulated permease PerM
LSERAPRHGWLSRERTLALVLLAATALALYLCYLLVLPFLPALALALALAVLAHPVHSWVRAFVTRDGLAAGLAVTIVAATIVAPASFVAHRLVKEATAGIERLTGEVGARRWQTALERHPRLAPALSWIAARLGETQAFDRLSERATAWLPKLVTGSLWALVEVAIAFLVLFYFFRDRSRALRTIRSLLPLTHEEIDAMFARVTDTVQATIHGSLVVAIIQGAMGGIIFAVLGLPAPVVWGVVMALLAVVPTLGTFVIWLPAATFLALEGSWVKALILVGWGALAIGTIDNLLYPVLVGQRLRLHPLAIFFAILGGLVVFGASGLILGPVVLSVTDALLEIWRGRTAGGRSVDSGMAPAA